MNRKDHEKLRIAEKMYLQLKEYEDLLTSTYPDGEVLSGIIDLPRIAHLTYEWEELKKDPREKDKKLDEALRKLEMNTIYQAGLRNINGGFATAEVINEDGDGEEIPCFNIELKYGVQNESENRVTTAYLKIRKDNYEILEEY